jgi:hypothetical protein
MLVRKLAVILSCLGVVLRLFVFAHGMMMLSLMMVMGGGVVMTGRSVMMLCRWMFSHLNALPCHGPDRTSIVRHSLEE